MKCLITGSLYKDKSLGSDSFINNASVAIFSQEDNSLIGWTVTDSADGRYTLTLPFDELYEVRYEAKGYQTKKVIIDLRNIPNDHKESWKLEADIWLDTISNSTNDSSLIDQTVDKMKYNSKLNKMEWEKD